MGLGLAEIAGAMLSRAEQRVEVSAQNLANTATPGYKARRAFSTLLSSNSDKDVVNGATMSTSVDLTSGQLRTTGAPLDLAISGSGFFSVRTSDRVFYTRNGQFDRDADGKLSLQGMALQGASGDIVVPHGNPKILADGTVLDGEEPVGRIALVNFANAQALHPAGAGLFEAGEEPPVPVTSELRQGALETSNVSTADEMVAIMASLRGAGSGQRLVQLYDDLMGRMVSALSQQS